MPALFGGDDLTTAVEKKLRPWMPERKVLITFKFTASSMELYTLVSIGVLGFGLRASTLPTTIHFQSMKPDKRAVSTAEAGPYLASATLLPAEFIGKKKHNAVRIDDER